MTRNEFLQISLLALVTVCLGFAYIQRLTIVTMWINAHEAPDPLMRIVPQPLSELGVNHDPGATIAQLKSGFEVPWNSPKATAVNTKLIARYSFENDRVIVIFSHDSDPDVMGVLRANPNNGLSRALGEEILSSKYALELAALNETPHSINIFTPALDVAGSNFLSVVKMTILQKGTRKIYSVSSSNVRGFQIGDPSTSNSVMLRLYDSSDQLHEVLVAAGSKSNKQLAQAEINRIIQTFRPIPENPPHP